MTTENSVFPCLVAEGKGTGRFSEPVECLANHMDKAWNILVGQVLLKQCFQSEFWQNTFAHTMVTAPWSHA